MPENTFSRGFTSEEPFLKNPNSMISGLLSVAPGNNSQIAQFNYQNGEFEWIKTLHQPDTSNVCTLNSTAKLNDYIYCGVQYFETGYDPTGNASLQKNDTLGNFIEEVILPVNFTSVIEEICITSDEKLLISATHSLVQDDVMLIKYNQNLEYETINTSQILYDSLCPFTITSGTIELACSIITGLNSQSKKGRSTLKLSPNPATDYTIIYLPETIETASRQGILDVTTFSSDYVKNLFLEVINLNGQIIYSEPWIDNSKEQVLSVSGWKSGMYLIRIRDNNRILSSGKLLVN
jgi:hypothetical protein